MTEKYYCEDYDEYSLSIKNIPYRIYDLTKSNKTKEDFYDNEKECYDIPAFEEYLLDNDCMLTSEKIKDRLIKQEKRIEQLEKFENSGEHIRLSINHETGKLQRHTYATGQWFGDFDRILVTNFISNEKYQKFIDRIIEVYNAEFKDD